MKEHKRAYVRFYASDWLAGTRGLRPQECGIYITLLMLMYERCEPLPDNPKRLARLCNTTPKAFHATLEMLIEEEKIIRTDEGLWNKRVGSEFEFRKQKSEQASEAVSKRWEKANKNKGGPIRAYNGRNTTEIPIPETIYHIPEDIDARASISNAREQNDSRISQRKKMEKEFDEEFWPIQENKVGKRVALKAYCSARKRADKQTIIEGYERYRKNKPPHREWCNPSTWLNQDRWLDQPAAAVTPMRSGGSDKAERRRKAIEETRKDFL